MKSGGNEQADLRQKNEALEGRTSNQIMKAQSERRGRSEVKSVRANGGVIDILKWRETGNVYFCHVWLNHWIHFGEFIQDNAHASPIPIS